MDKARWKEACLVAERVFSSDVVIKDDKDIYGAPMKVDFVYMDPGRRTPCVVIHARWQQVGGSVDQKFPFFMLNAKKCRYPVIFVLGGDGFKAGARKWLESEARRAKNVLHVFSEEQFQEWANNGNL